VLNVIMLSVAPLNVNMPSAVMPSVVTPLLSLTLTDSLLDPKTHLYVIVILADKAVHRCQHSRESILAIYDFS
jgi:hypothetical protein